MTDRFTPTPEQLKEIVAKSRAFWRSEPGGERANLEDANLEGANLEGANLGGANLGGANLEDANLEGANLGGANLEDANLEDANLEGANLGGAYLGGAYLGGANLGGAYLGGAYLGGANLEGANLEGANLEGANLINIKRDLYQVLRAAPNELAGLRQALTEGRINGSCYEGECACLVGTIANLRQMRYDEMDDIAPRSSRPIEKFFLAIAPGHTPDNHPVAKIVAEWIDEFLALAEPNDVGS